MTRPMSTRALVATLVGTSVLAGCSHPAPVPPRPPEAVSTGTAQVTVGDTPIDPTYAVACTSAAFATIITTGDNAAGTTSFVDHTDALVAKSVSIRNLGGFTGSYEDNVDGDAKVHMAGQTYVITGTASGFNADNPSATASRTFTIRVSC
jgi:hypothetical protein